MARQKEDIEALQNKYPIKAKPIPTMPSKILIKDVENEINGINNVPVGISKQTLEIVRYNFERNIISKILGKNMEDVVDFSVNLIEEFKLINNNNIYILDAERIFNTRKANLSGEYYKLIKTANNENEEMNIIFIFGIDKFLADIEMDEEEFLKTVNKLYELKNYKIIIAETETRFKNHQFDRWYQEYNRDDTGIWVGNGFSDQYVIVTNENNINNSCGSSYGYVANNGKATAVKFIGMKEKGEDNE